LFIIIGVRPVIRIRQATEVAVAVMGRELVPAMKRTLLYRAARKVYRGIVPRRPSIWELNDQYDRQTVEVMRRTLRPDSTAVDIGAHAGAILREMFSVAPRGRHFAFEPLPHLAASLRRNYPEARVHAVALNDTAGTGTFHYVVNSPAESGLRLHAIHGDASNVQQITVPIRRLDDVIGLDERISFIKIDAEGAELPIIRGGLDMIRRCRPAIVFESGDRSTPYYGVGPDDIFSTIVEQLGMRLSTMARWLEGRPPYTHRRFRRDCRHEFYFIAY